MITRSTTTWADSVRDGRVAFDCVSCHAHPATEVIRTDRTGRRPGVIETALCRACLAVYDANAEVIA